MYFFIVNPSSRSNHGRVVWKSVEKELKRLRINYKVFFTNYPYHAIKIASKVCEEPGNKTIVAVGGDGTVNEVINGINDFEKVRFGYIPTGSANDFARGLNLPVKTKKALENILYSKNIKDMSIGRMRCSNGTYKFANSCGIGLDAYICAKANSSPLKAFFNKFHLGFLTYAIVCIQQIFTFKPLKLTATIDDEKSITVDKCFFCAIMNNICEGGGLRLAPTADPFDDMFDVCIVDGINIPKLICVLPLAFSGRHTFLKEVTTFRCKKLQISSDVELPIHRDGEIDKPVKELTISMEPRSLKVIC